MSQLLLLFTTPCCDWLWREEELNEEEVEEKEEEGRLLCES